MPSQQIQCEPWRSHNSSTSHTQVISLDYRIKANNHPITFKQTRSTNSGVAHPLQPRPARAPFTGGNCYMSNRDVSTHRDRTTRPRLFDSYVPGRDRSHSNLRDGRNCRPGRHPYVRHQEYRTRSPARDTTTSQPQRPYHIDPIKTKGDLCHPTYSHGPPLPRAITHPPSRMTTLETQRSSLSYINTSLQRDASRPADGIIENLLKQGMLPSQPPKPGSHASDNHGSQNQPDQPRRVSNSYRPRPMKMHHRPFSEPPNYAKLDREAPPGRSQRPLIELYENVAEILHVNDSKFDERWDGIQHMSVKELREEAEAWKITIDAHVASEYAPLLAEIAASKARVTNHNSLKRAMQVIQDREAKAAGKVKSVLKASRLVREAAAKAAAKAEEEKQKASSPVVQASKKRKATQSQTGDSGYSKADAKSCVSPADLNDDDDEEGPVNRAKERVAACDTSQDHHQKPIVIVKKGSKRKSSSIDDGEGIPNKRQKTGETIISKKPPLKSSLDDESSKQKAVVLPQARKIRRTKTHSTGPNGSLRPSSLGSLHLPPCAIEGAGHKRGCCGG